MNIDYSKFVLKCDNEDCSRNENHMCCVSCDLFEKCKKERLICTYLDKHDSPEDCNELYLKKEQKGE